MKAINSIYKAPFKIEVEKSGDWVDSMAITDASGADVIRHYSYYEQYAPDTNEGATWIAFMEALNVMHETGKTPHQLAEENAKLREIAESLWDFAIVQKKGFVYPAGTISTLCELLRK